MEPKPEPKPFKMPKKVEKKPEPEPEPVPEEPKKIVKKKPSTRPKEEPKEEEAPFAMKLKKTERVQREWKDPEMETVKLAHHEFEKAPQPVEVQIVLFWFLLVNGYIYWFYGVANRSGGYHGFHIPGFFIQGNFLFQVSNPNLTFFIH